MARSYIFLNTELLKNGAVAVALEELTKAGSTYGVSFCVEERRKVDRVPNSITVTSSQEEAEAWLRRAKDQKGMRRGFPAKGDGFGMWVLKNHCRLVYAPSPRGVAYALFHLADQMSNTGRFSTDGLVLDPAFEDRIFLYVDIPDADTGHAPYVSVEKLSSGMEDVKKQLREALRYGANHVVLTPTFRLIRWDPELERQRSAHYREHFRKLVDYAHQLELKVFIIGDELLYTDSLLRKFNARLSPEDRNFWEALKHRYRTLLTDMPGLDGVGVRIGEIIPHRNARAFDMIHNGSSLSLEEKYRRFIENMYEVIVGEFGKVYFHRTWATSDWEQHSVADIYERIFRRLPIENLTVSTKLTKTDQWDYQAFNPTIGLSPHKTVVELEIAKGEHGSQRFPDFMGLYDSAGLQYARTRGVVGVAVPQLHYPFWGEASLYAASKLMWNPDQDVRRLARDWSAKRFGKRAASDIADLMMTSYDALMKSLYLKPYASTHAWNPLPHIATDRYSLGGDPILDGGKGHMNFLHELYLQCKPWLQETIEEVDEGVSMYGEMRRLFRRAKASIEDPRTARMASESLQLGDAFVKLSALYSTSFLRFFEYREKMTKRHRLRLERLLRRLRSAVATYRKKGGTFDTFAIEQFSENAQEFAANPGKAEKKLSHAPDQEQVIEILGKAREEDESQLKSSPRAVKVLHWEGNVDGKDLLLLKGRVINLVHLAYAQPTEVAYEFFSDVPKNSRLIIDRLEVRGHVIVARQPSRANGWTAAVYISDFQEGRDIYRFDVYAVKGNSKS